MAERVVLVRHGETEWSRSRRHTGRTDVALTELGRRRAEALAPVLADLAGIDGAQVLTSPLARARDTCALAGLGDRAAVCDDLAEWDYGTAEGRRTEEIREEIPGWSVWTHTVEGGESLAAVGARTESVIARLDARPGLAVLFAHAHLLRILGARWCGLEASAGQLFTLEPASVSVLGHEREARVIEHWNIAAPDGPGPGVDRTRAPS